MSNTLYQGTFQAFLDGDNKKMRERVFYRFLWYMGSHIDA